MRIIINNASTFKGGAEQVALSFIEECKKHAENEYAVVIGKNLASQINIHDYPDNFQFHIIEKRPATGLFNFYKTMQWLNKLEKDFRPDCVISTGGHGYWKPKAPHVSGYNMAHYIYPESPYFKTLSIKKRMYWKVRKAFDFFFYGRVDALIGQTKDVSQRLQQYFTSKKVFTVPNTVHSVFTNPPITNKKLPAKTKGEIRLLTVSANYPHKNLAVINEVIEVFRKRAYENIRFVLTLPQDAFQNTFPDKTKRNFIYNVGPAPIKEVPALFKECDFMFLPTLLECFSASYVEAMHMNTPILTSDLGFAHTVCSDAALYFNPLDANEIAEQIIRLINDQELQKDMVKKGEKLLKSYNTPESRAQQFLEVCNEAVKSKGAENRQ